MVILEGFWASWAALVAFRGGAVVFSDGAREALYRAVGLRSKREHAWLCIVCNGPLFQTAFPQDWVSAQDWGNEHVQNLLGFQSQEVIDT